LTSIAQYYPKLENSKPLPALVVPVVADVVVLVVLIVVVVVAVVVDPSCLKEISLLPLQMGFRGM